MARADWSMRLHDEGNGAMKTWLKTWMAFLAARERTCTFRRTDWRSRPVGEHTATATHRLGRPEGDPYTTLRLPTFGEAPGVPRNLGLRVDSAQQTSKPTPDPRSA